MAHVDFRDNEVRGTTLRGIAVTEMSMGKVRKNECMKKIVNDNDQAM